MQCSSEALCQVQRVHLRVDAWLARKEVIIRTPEAKPGDLCTVLAALCLNLQITLESAGTEVWARLSTLSALDALGAPLPCEAGNKRS